MTERNVSKMTNDMSEYVNGGEGKVTRWWHPVAAVSLYNSI
jgi:hypothetical protein